MTFNFKASSERSHFKLLENHKIIEIEPSKQELRLFKDPDNISTIVIRYTFPTLPLPVQLVTVGTWCHSDQWERLAGGRQ